MNWIELWRVAPGDLIGVRHAHPSIVTVEDVTGTDREGVYALDWSADDGTTGTWIMSDLTLVDLIRVDDPRREPLLHAGHAELPVDMRDVVVGRVRREQEVEA